MNDVLKQALCDLVSAVDRLPVEYWGPSGDGDVRVRVDTAGGLVVTQMTPEVRVRFYIGFHEQTRNRYTCIKAERGGVFVIDKAAILT